MDNLSEDQQDTAPGSRSDEAMTEHHRGDDGRVISGSAPMVVASSASSLHESNVGGRYEARRRLGRGGMGEVRLCKDSRIGREVAMKVMLPSCASNEAARARFLREAQVQGQLEHPAIVPVYDMGLDASGSAYFTMKRLRGMTLADVIEGLLCNNPEVVKAFSRRRLLTAFSAVCLAVDFAHSRGVLHRDLKPSNIMLGDFGEVYVLDWGIAKIEEGSDRALAVEVGPEALVGETSAGALLGSICYMSPEQARGMHESLDAKSDVFSLGAILFELLTFERLRPWEEASEMLVSVLKGVDARASVRAPDREVPPELEAICIKATRSIAAERFASARELHDAVERCLDGERDIELRREMAAAHASVAEQVAADALGGRSGAEGARRRALREIGRALALDPMHKAAMRLLGRIIKEPPRECPREVKVRAEEARAARERLRRKLLLCGEVGMILLMIPALLWMGVRNEMIVGAFVAVQLGSIFFRAVLVRSEAAPSVLAYIPYLLNIVGIALLGRIYGPLFLVPISLAVQTFLNSMTPNKGLQKLILIAPCFVMFGGVGLELAGVLAPSYSFHDGAMTILPNAVNLSMIPTYTALSVLALAVIIMPAVGISMLRMNLLGSEECLMMQAWHLQQLLPDEEGAPEQSEAPLGLPIF